MGQLDLDIVFKQTTSNFIKCKMCSSSVEGEDGYIKINLYTVEDGYYHNSVEKRIVICPKCFKKWIDRIITATENKKESYNKMVKTKILKSLK